MTATLSLDNPVFWTYAMAASIMLLKLLLQPWMTVARMMQVGGGFRNPEDAKKSPMNPTPSLGQLEPNDYVERSRRLNLNDLVSWRMQQHSCTTSAQLSGASARSQCL